MSGETLVLAVLLGLGVVLIGIWLVASRRAALRVVTHGVAERGLSPAEAERLATPASEAIEDLVNQKLVTIPGLADTRVDFGTSADGSLEIWIGSEHYTAVDEIPDPRIRQSVKDAVEAFNR